MRITALRFSVLALSIVLSLVVPVGTSPATHKSVYAEALAPIDGIAQREIASGHIPGAVVLIGQGDDIMYRRAFGWRSVRPAPVSMTVDTIFDLASLTKVVATTTAVMQLVEHGDLNLDASVATYWPRFATAGKRGITIRQLMTHYSGLRADLDLRHPWTGYRTAMNLLIADRPIVPPGTRYLYSDENFEVLGEVVRRVSGRPLDRYCAQQIFQPLRMNETRFLPPQRQADRIAPTEGLGVEPGTVNDPTAFRMGGIAGHAGLFSTADDLAMFARMLVAGGTLDGVRVLGRDSIAQMVQAQAPPAAARLRGLGWDVGGPSVPDGVSLFPAGSFGHTGFTGTMIWIDAASKTYVIVLTNRTYPDGRGDVQPLRKQILDLVSVSLGSLSPAVAAR